MHSPMPSAFVIGPLALGWQLGWWQPSDCHACCLPCGSGSLTLRFGPDAGNKSCPVVIEQVPDALHANVGWRECSEGLRIVSVVSLLGEHGGDLGSPDLFHRVEDAQFIVNQDVLVGREAA